MGLNKGDTHKHVTHCISLLNTSHRGGQDGQRWGSGGTMGTLGVLPMLAGKPLCCVANQAEVLQTKLPPWPVGMDSCLD